MSLLKKANAAFKKKEYQDSINLYHQAIKKYPALKDFIKFNITYTKKIIESSPIHQLEEKRNEPAKLIKKSLEKVFEGRLDINKENLLEGWAVEKGDPAAIFELTVYIDDVEFCKIKNDKNRSDLVRHKKSKGKGGFSLSIPEKLFSMKPKKLEIKYPNGELLISLTMKDKLISNSYQSVSTLTQEKVSVIVPIYNAADDLKVCIERLIKYTNNDTDIILIDDASPDPEIQSILHKAKNYENVRIYKNKQNLGFTKTVNRGIELAGQNDVVLLNSDARVTPKWLEGLRAALATNSKIATVTPMSDRAGAFSAPNIGNENTLPDGITEEEYAIAFRRRSIGIYPRVPTGNGFCMYVRRTCINEIGILDDQAFPRGYGEENDFCMRAQRNGWLNIIDDRTYVFHDRSKSFGEAKTELMKAGRSVVDKRYPEYKYAIQVFNTGKEIALARYCSRLAINDCISNRKSICKPRILFVIATQTGGTPQTNRDLMGALSDVFQGWVLRCDSKTLELSCINEAGTNQIVHSHQLEEAVDALTHNSSEYDRVVSNWLKDFDFNLVHIRHLGWHGLTLPYLSKMLGIKVVYSFHDFYALSSNLKLIDDTGKFLGNNYFDECSIYRENLWPNDALPPPHGNWLDFWRERFQAALEYCDAFVTTSESARSLILEKMSQLPKDRFVVIPHGRDFPNFYNYREVHKKEEPIRILLPGNINEAKGFEIIKALGEYDVNKKIEFHILGNTRGRAIPRVIRHGAYKREEFASKVASIRPHIGAVFSIWDETYCHTLTELWSVGLPAIVFNYPNLTNRVQQCGAGWVLGHSDIPKLYNEIIRIALDKNEYKKAEDAVINWQTGYGLAYNTAQMAAGYINIYSDVLREKCSNFLSLSPYSRIRVGVVCPSSKDLKYAPGSTHIRIWERTQNSLCRNVTYIRMTPEELLANAKENMLDGVIIQRTAIPQNKVKITINALSKSKIPYILDLDDDLLNVPSDKDNEKIYANYAPFLRELIDSAELITVSTPKLQNRIKELHKKTFLLPNYLSDRIWRKPLEVRVEDDNIHALYMGSPTHDDDLAMVLPALDTVAKNTPQFRLTLIGVTNKKHLINSRPWLKILDSPSKEYIGFINWLLEQACQFDFSIAPLRDTSFNAYKSDLKILDYGMMGLPVIASDVNAYKNTSAPGVRLIENSTQAWVAALHHQISLGSHNHSLGVKLNQWVIKERMLQKTLPFFDDTITSNMSTKKPS